MSEYECRPLRRFLVPKPEGGYRAAIQLDPLDTIIFTALVYEAAPLIEKQRVSLDQKVSCSYRVEIDANGQLFRPDNGWGDFHGKSNELATSGKHQYVALADIADFYNQISHHRVRNALEVAGVSPERAKNFEELLMNLTGGQSRGVPVGPSASILLAEACLSDVDMFLLRKGCAFSRYVDDFRIFCANKSEAYQALHDLSEYLYTAHRLALQSSKTKVISIDRFAQIDLLDPEKLEQQRKTEKISEFLSAMSAIIGYANLSEEDIPPGEQRTIVINNLKDLFDACLARGQLRLGLARYVLRRATVLKTSVLQDRVINNIDTLVPVMRDVAIYLLKTTQSKNAAKVSQALISFLQKSDYAFMPFAKLWAIHVLTELNLSEVEQALKRICEEIRDQMGVRPLALLARTMKYIDWVRAQKETWQNNGPWDRRAIIWSATALSDDERKYWLKRVQNAGDILDNAVAKAILATTSSK